MEPTQDVSLFQLPPDEVLELPEPQGGQIVYVKVRALDGQQALAYLQGIPSAVPSGADGPADLASMGAAINRLAEAGIVSPEFSFSGPAEGKADWRAVTVGNRGAIAVAILRLSGVRTATPLERFRSDGSGAADGADAGAASEPAAVSEPGPTGSAG